MNKQTLPLEHNYKAAINNKIPPAIIMLHGYGSDENDLFSFANELPEKYAMVFRMKTVQEFETEEICKELGITSSNLWVMIHRARIQLRKCMEDNWFNN